ncbi:MAG: hypothetical protein NTX73_05770 [Rhodobacterales bacterium]|nr:hypothetical protein [Rhodobacterales bacterium]
MAEPSTLTITATKGLERILAGEPSMDRLNMALRHLAKWRSQVIAQTLSGRDGPVITHGPFKGMNYDVSASEGAYVARRLGCYEASLVPVIETIIARNYPLIVDVGCAEGYYAVGLALRMPDARVLARDMDDGAQTLCAKLAAKNGVTDRVQVGGLFDHADFAVTAAQPTVVICDIEGAEDGLLDPAKALGLLDADILVEVHEGMVPGLTARLAARFAGTHRVTQIGRTVDPTALPGWMENQSDLDRLLALWEWRAAPTPWLWIDRYPQG